MMIADAGCILARGETARKNKYRPAGGRRSRGGHKREATPTGWLLFKIQTVMALFNRRLGFVPFFFFFFDRHVQLDGVEPDNFQLRAAIVTLDNVAFIGVFVHLNLGVAFGARSSWHLLYSSVIRAKLHDRALGIATENI
jgi:hypothetical protein